MYIYTARGRASEELHILGSNIESRQATPSNLESSPQEFDLPMSARHMA